MWGECDNTASPGTEVQAPDTGIELHGGCGGESVKKGPSKTREGGKAWEEGLLGEGEAALGGTWTAGRLWSL